MSNKSLEILKFVCPHCGKRQEIELDKDIMIEPIICKFCGKANYNRGLKQ